MMFEMERSSRGWWCFPRRSAPRSCCQRRGRRRRAAVERQTLAPHWTMQQQAPARSVRRPHRAQTARWPEESLSSAAAATNGDLPSRQRMPSRPLPHWPRRRRLRIPSRCHTGGHYHCLRPPTTSCCRALARGPRPGAESRRRRDSLAVEGSGSSLRSSLPAAFVHNPTRSGEQWSGTAHTGPDAGTAAAGVAPAAAAATAGGAPAVRAAP